MSRNDFMKQLETLLQNISPAEREEALQYYNDYFDDAGLENEQSVIEALGNPARVAENIKRDLYGNGYGDNVYQRTTPIDKAVVPYTQTGNGSQGAQGNSAQAGTVNGDGENGKLSTGMIVLIVILCILASPILLSVASGILSLAVGLIATWFSLIVGFGVAALALIAAFLVLLVVGVICLFAEPLVGVGVIGVGMICGGLGILFLMLTVAMAGIATPAMFSGIVSLCRKIFKK